MVLVGNPLLFQAFIAYLPFISLFFPAAAMLFGVTAGTVCNFATQIKFFAGYDDFLDVSVFDFGKCRERFIR